MPSVGDKPGELTRLFLSPEAANVVPIIFLATKLFSYLRVSDCYKDTVKELLYLLKEKCGRMYS